MTDSSIFEVPTSAAHKAPSASRAPARAPADVNNNNSNNGADMRDKVAGGAAMNTASLSDKKTGIFPPSEAKKVVGGGADGAEDVRKGSGSGM